MSCESVLWFQRYARRQTDRHADRCTDRRVDHNTPHSYRGRVNTPITCTLAMLVKLILLLMVSVYVSVHTKRLKNYLSETDATRLEHVLWCRLQVMILTTFHLHLWQWQKTAYNLKTNRSVLCNFTCWCLRMLCFILQVCGVWKHNGRALAFVSVQVQLPVRVQFSHMPHHHQAV